jgi:subtilisin family serine protease
MKKYLFSFLIIIISHYTNAQHANQAYKATNKYFSMPANIRAGDYIEKTVVLKVKPEYRSLCTANNISHDKLNDFLKEMELLKIEKIFPDHDSPLREYNERGEKLADLSLIYKLEYASDQISLEKVINILYSFKIFEFAEPKYLPKANVTPNDANISKQTHLSIISAYTGWDVSTGDTNVVIGITDTGTDPSHSDLTDNVKKNYADPINGSDDDNDGYLDNYSGWDLGENDNDPTWQGDGHGVHVTGLAAATTNNATGVAGVGYKCKFLPVKVADSNGDLTEAYEGIVYAADHGCSIINCSWGGSGGGSYGQTIIDYATINKNALVIAAAGNDGVETEFYPANFNYVISVANTNSSDKKNSSSNYGHWIDICAPGSSLYSTYVNGGYSTMTGTSMSAPVASGAAAIIKSYFPGYTALQIGEQLKMTCDDISSVNTNYKDKLGRGRINLYNALTQTGSPSIVMTSRTITDNNNEVFLVNDTLSIYGDFTNYLSAASANLTATLATTSSYVGILNSSLNLGVISTLGVVNNNSNPFTVKINSGAPQNAEIEFSITYADGSYTATEYFSVIVNVDYINITINDVHTTITSIGRVGYNGTGQTEGLGFSYMGGESIVYEAGLMVGSSSTKVSDGVRNGSSSTDEDFSSVSNVMEIDTLMLSEFDVKGTFDDVQASSPMNIKIDHNAYAWTTAGNTKYVIVEYLISNKGSSTISNLYAGLFADWDIDAATYGSNRAEYDATNKMGYVYYTGTGLPYAGIKLLSSTASAIHYAVDNISGGGGGVDLYDGFSDSEKYTTLSTNRTKAGSSGSGNDVIDIVSSGPFTLGANDTAVVAFALIAGDDLDDIKTSAVNAQYMYDSNVKTTYTSMIDQMNNHEGFFVQCYPNPTKNEINLLYSIANSTSEIKIEIFNSLGVLVKSISATNHSSGVQSTRINISDLVSGIYSCYIKTAEENHCLKVLKE